MELPGLNSRILELIQHETFGKVRPFAELIGFEQPQKLNRLFKPDRRNGEYPVPSTDIILAILDSFTDLNIEWLLRGVGSPKKESANSHIEAKVEHQSAPSESDIMKTLEMLYLHEDVMMENKMYTKWLSKKEALAENRLLKKIKQIEG